MRLKTRDNMDPLHMNSHRRTTRIASVEAQNTHPLTTRTLRKRMEDALSWVLMVWALSFVACIQNPPLLFPCLCLGGAGAFAWGFCICGLSSESGLHLAAQPGVEPMMGYGPTENNRARNNRCAVRPGEGERRRWGSRASYPDITADDAFL